MLKYTEFLNKTSFSQEELLDNAYGRGLEDFPEDIGHLPQPPMLMLDRVIDLRRASRNGFIIGEQDVRPELWFFKCHFLNDPVQPGCLGLDAIWQLLGLYSFASGGRGLGRALGCQEVSFFGQIRPHHRVVRYEVQIKRFQLNPTLRTTLLVGDGKVFVDEEPIYDIVNAKGGTFKGIEYPQRPPAEPHGISGALR